MSIISAAILSSVLFASRPSLDHLTAKKTTQNQGYIYAIQAKSLRGYVRLTNIGTPVEGFIVEQWSPKWKHRLARRVTDADGFFAFNPVKPGKYYLKYHREGFATDRAVIIVSSRSTANIELITESTGDPAPNNSMQHSAQASLVVAPEIRCAPADARRYARPVRFDENPTERPIDHRDFGIASKPIRRFVDSRRPLGYGFDGDRCYNSRLKESTCVLFDA